MSSDTEALNAGVPPPASTGGAIGPNLNGGSQPKSRLPKAEQARRLCVDRVKDLSLKWAVWDDVLAKYDCIAPDDPAYLKAQGLGHATNVCWGTMESRVDEIVETYYNLACGGETFLRFHTRAEDPLSIRALRILAGEHKIMWDGWTGRQEMMETLIFHRSLYPFSAVYYEQPSGWHCRALDPRSLIYPPGAGTDVDTWEYCLVRTKFEAWQLLRKLEHESTASEAGWKPSQIRKACKLLCKEGAAVMTSIIPRSTWEDVTWEQLAPVDLLFRDVIPCFVVYVREWDGSISEHIMVDHSEMIEYIYSSPGKHRLLSDVLTLFPHGLGDGTLGSVRSHGIKSLPYHDALDRLTNNELDTAIVTSSLILQGDGGPQLEKAAECVMNIGGLTLLPSGFSPVQTNFRDAAAGIRLSKQDLRQSLGRNNPSMAGEIDLGDYEKSQREAAMLYQNSLQIGMFKVDRFRSQMDRFCGSHWKRVLAALEKGAPEECGNREAKGFLQMCAQLGVTVEHLQGIYRVSHRTGGARGNKVNEQMGMDRARQYFGMFSEDGKRDFARRDIELALDSADEARVWLASGSPGDGESEQARVAQLENSSMSVGQPVQAAGTDMDGLHMQEHTSFLLAETEKCKRGQSDPAACLRTISLEQAHVEPHMQRLSLDKFWEQDFKALQQQWSQFENYRRQLEQQLKAQQAKALQAQQEAARTPALDPKDRQKLAFGQLEMGQKQQKHEQELRHAEEDHLLKIREGAGVLTEA